MRPKNWFYISFSLVKITVVCLLGIEWRVFNNNIMNGIGEWNEFHRILSWHENWEVLTYNHPQRHAHHVPKLAQSSTSIPSVCHAKIKISRIADESSPLTFSRQGNKKPLNTSRVDDGWEVVLAHCRVAFTAFINPSVWIVCKFCSVYWCQSHPCLMLNRTKWQIVEYFVAYYAVNNGPLARSPLDNTHFA